MFSHKEVPVQVHTQGNDLCTFTQKEMAATYLCMNVHKEMAAKYSDFGGKIAKS